MATPVWTRAFIKGLAAAGCTISVLAYGINNEFRCAELAAKAAYPFHTPSVPWDSNWDKREPESLLKPSKELESGDCKESKESSAEREKELAKLKPKTTRHIFLVRHGQYSMDGQGDEEKGLSCLGKDQAKLTGQRLRELAFPYTIIVRSTMSRATETAEIIAKCLPGVPSLSCDMIREGAPIPPEPAVNHWRPEAQQFYEDGARIEAAFRKYFHRADPCQEQDSYEVMVCHSNVIRYFVCRAMQFPPEAWLRFSLHNCSITWLVIHPSGRVVLKALGDSGHISTDKLTTS